VPLLPVSLIEPLWVQFSTQLDDADRPEFVAGHPWLSPPPDPRPCGVRPRARRLGPRQRLRAHRHSGVFGSQIRRRVADWAERGVGIALLKVALAAYDQLIGLDLYDLSVDGSITKSPCRGDFRVDPRST